MLLFYWAKLTKYLNLLMIPIYQCMFLFFSFYQPIIISFISSLTSYPPQKNIYELVERTNIYGGLVYLRFPQN